MKYSINKNPKGIIDDNEQMDFATTFASNYDKAWKNAVKDAKSAGFYGKK